MKRQGVFDSISNCFPALRDHLVYEEFTFFPADPGEGPWLPPFIKPPASLFLPPPIESWPPKPLSKSKPPKPDILSSRGRIGRVAKTKRKKKKKEKKQRKRRYSPASIYISKSRNLLFGLIVLWAGHEKGQLAKLEISSFIFWGLLKKNNWHLKKVPYLLEVKIPN